MRQLTINPNNRQYYSEDFIKGFNCGAQRQFEADKSDADRPQGEWIYCEEDDSHLPEDGRYGIFKCSNCGSKQSFPISEGSGRVYGDNYCPSCGARMKGADDE